MCIHSGTGNVQQSTNKHDHKSRLKSTCTKTLDIKTQCNTEVKELYGTELKNCFEVLGNIIEEPSLNDAHDIINSTIKMAQDVILEKIQSSVDYLKYPCAGR